MLHIKQLNKRKTLRSFLYMQYLQQHIKLQLQLTCTLVDQVYSSLTIVIVRLCMHRARKEICREPRHLSVTCLTFCPSSSNIRYVNKYFFFNNTYCMFIFLRGIYLEIQIFSRNRMYKMKVGCVSLFAIQITPRKRRINQNYLLRTMAVVQRKLQV